MPRSCPTKIRTEVAGSCAHTPEDPRVRLHHDPAVPAKRLGRTVGQRQWAPVRAMSGAAIALEVLSGAAIAFFCGHLLLARRRPNLGLVGVAVPAPQPERDPGGGTQGLGGAHRLRGRDKIHCVHRWRVRRPRGHSDRGAAAVPLACWSSSGRSCRSWAPWSPASLRSRWRRPPRVWSPRSPCWWPSSSSRWMASCSSRW